MPQYLVAVVVALQVMELVELLLPFMMELLLV